MELRLSSPASNEPVGRPEADVSAGDVVEVRVSYGGVVSFSINGQQHSRTARARKGS